MPPSAPAPTGPDRLVGTRSADTIFALGGNDRSRAAAGGDFLHGGAGRDLVLGEARVRPHRGPFRPGSRQRRLRGRARHRERRVARRRRRRLRGRRAAALARRASPAPGAARDAGRAGQPGRGLDDRHRLPVRPAGRGWGRADRLGDLDRRRTSWRAGFLEPYRPGAATRSSRTTRLRRTWLIATLGANEDTGGSARRRSADGLSWSRSAPRRTTPASATTRNG